MVEDSVRKYEQEHLRRLDCSLDATVENTIFQLIKIEENLIPFIFKRQLHLTGKICSAYTSVTNKYVVFFHLETVIIKGFTNITLIQ